MPHRIELWINSQLKDEEWPAGNRLFKPEDVCKGNIEYLFYTVRMSDDYAALIKRRVSCDGYHFEKDNSFSMFLSEKYS